MRKNTSTTIRLTDLLPLYVVILLSFFGYALTIALFIPMLMDRHFALLSADATVATRVSISGALLAMYPLGQFFGAPVIGRLSDHYGRKKVLLISLVLCVLGFVGMAVSIAWHSLAWLFVFCLFTGLCESNMAIAQSVIADNVKDGQQKMRLIGYAFSACSLGYVLGPLLGGPLAHHFSYSVPFSATALLSLLLLVWLRYAFNDRYRPDHSININLWAAVFALKTLFTHRHVRKIYVINFLIFFAIQGLYRVVPLYIEDTWQPSLVLYTTIIAYVSLLCLLANLFLIGRLAAFFTTRNLLIGLLIVGGGLVIAIVLPQSFHWIWLTYGLAVIPTVMALTTCTTWLSNQVSAKEQGQVLGNNQALLVLGEASSAAIGGAVAAISVPLPVVMMGVILLVCAVMVFLRKS